MSGVQLNILIAASFFIIPLMIDLIVWATKRETQEQSGTNNFLQKYLQSKMPLYRRICLWLASVALIAIIIFLVLTYVNNAHAPQSNWDESPSPTIRPSETAQDVSLNPEPKRETVLIAEERVSKLIYEVASAGCPGDRVEVEVADARADEIHLLLGLDDLSPSGRSVQARGNPEANNEILASRGYKNVTVKMTDGRGLLYLESIRAIPTDCNSEPIRVIVENVVRR